MKALLALVVVLALGGCGLGPGEAKTGGGAQLSVTRDFGQQELGSPVHRGEVRDSDTVMRLLQTERKVATRYGGGFVQSIDGLAGNQGAEHDWFFYVNGSESSVGASDYQLNAGDVVQWDYHDWQATQHIPAIVGAYPEPFVHGLKGKRLPVILQCENDSSLACKRVGDSLDKLGITVSSAAIGSPAGDKSLRVIVARFGAAEQVRAAKALTSGPATSGVYARFDPSGDVLNLLDAAGHSARPAPPGTGLVAATQQAEQPITWLVTGVDDAAVDRAATALDPAKLRNAFAAAVTPTGIVKLPVR
jgi:Domain of unknown function (DUF4430)